mgnify:CR=1 FL=1
MTSAGNAVFRTVRWQLCAPDPALRLRLRKPRGRQAVHVYCISLYMLLSGLYYLILSCVASENVFWLLSLGFDDGN